MCETAHAAAHAAAHATAHTAADTVYAGDVLYMCGDK